MLILANIFRTKTSTKQGFMINIDLPLTLIHDLSPYYHSLTAVIVET